MIEQAKFTYFSLAKASEKQKKTNEDQGRNQIDVITNQNKKLATLTNQDNDKDNYSYKEILEEIFKERFDEIKELAYEINHNDLIFWFKGNVAIKRFDHFNNGIELFRKIQSGEIKLNETKNCRMCLHRI